MDKHLNFALQTNFRINIPELPFVTALAQDVTMPAITLNPALADTRWLADNQPGEKIVFTELDIGFMMDENYDAYAEIFSWMTRMAGPEGRSEILTVDRRVLFCDTTISVLDNAQREVRKFTFTDSWPTAIGATSYDVTGDGTTVKSILTLQYLAMTIDPPTKNLTGASKVVYNH